MQEVCLMTQNVKIIQFIVSYRKQEEEKRGKQYLNVSFLLKGKKQETL